MPTLPSSPPTHYSPQQQINSTPYSFPTQHAQTPLKKSAAQQDENDCLTSENAYFSGFKMN